MRAAGRSGPDLWTLGTSWALAARGPRRTPNSRSWPSQGSSKHVWCADAQNAEKPACRTSTPKLYAPEVSECACALALPTSPGRPSQNQIHLVCAHERIRAATLRRACLSVKLNLLSDCHPDARSSARESRVMMPNALCCIDCYANTTATATADEWGGCVAWS